MSPSQNYSLECWLSKSRWLMKWEDTDKKGQFLVSSYSKFVDMTYVMVTSFNNTILYSLTSLNELFISVHISKY